MRASPERCRSSALSRDEAVEVELDNHLTGQLAGGMPADLTLLNAAPTFGSHFLARERPDAGGPGLFPKPLRKPTRFGYSDEISSQSTGAQQHDPSLFATRATPRDNGTSTPIELQQTLRSAPDWAQLVADFAQPRRQYRERSALTTGGSSLASWERERSSKSHTSAYHRLGPARRYGTAEDESDEDSIMDPEGGNGQPDEGFDKYHRRHNEYDYESEGEHEKHSDTKSRRRDHGHFYGMPRRRLAMPLDDPFAHYSLHREQPDTKTDEANSHTNSGRGSPSTGLQEYYLSDMLHLDVLHSEGPPVFDRVANTISEDRTGSDDAVVGQVLRHLDTKASRMKQLLSVTRKDDPLARPGEQLDNFDLSNLAAPGGPAAAETETEHRAQQTRDSPIEPRSGLVAVSSESESDEDMGFGLFD